jgi:hypothetical protein
LHRHRIFQNVTELTMTPHRIVNVEAMLQNVLAKRV